MDWNNFFMSGSNQNYNFVPGGFPSANGAGMYQNGQPNWQYYAAYNQNYISEPPSMQPVVSPLVAPPPYGGVFSQNSRDYSEVNVGSGIVPTFSVVNGEQRMGLNETFSTPTDALASILSVSSLTPTAGEFIPRSKNVEQIENKQRNVTPRDTGLVSSTSASLQQIPGTIANNDNQHLRDEKFVNDSGVGNNSDNNDINGKNSFLNSNNSVGDVNCEDFTGKKKSGSEWKNSVEEEMGDSGLDVDHKNCHSSSENNPTENSAPKMLEGTSTESDSNVKDAAAEGARHRSSTSKSINSGYDTSMRKGSGRILQNRMSENLKGPKSRESKNQGRQRLLAQAATFYSSSSSSCVENTQAVDVNSSNMSSKPDRLGHPRENFYGKSTNQDAYFNHGRNYYGQHGNKGDGRSQEYDMIFDGNSSKGREKSTSFGRTYYSQHSSQRSERNDRSEGNEMGERNSRSGKSNRNERYDRGERNGRTERNDRVMKNDRDERSDKGDKRERNEWSEKGEKWDKGDRNDRKERSDWNDRGERNDWKERGDWNERRDRGEKEDRNERADRNERYGKCERGSRWDRDSRSNQNDRADLSVRADKGDRDDTGKHRKTFFSNRFNSRNFDASPSGQDVQSENNTYFLQNKGRKYGANQYPNELHSENKNRFFSKYDTSLGRKYLPNEQSSSESDNNVPSSKYESSNVASASEKNSNRDISEKSNAKLQNDCNNIMRLPQSGSLRSNNAGRFYHADDEASQRERLSDQLSRGALECLVCCERVRQHDAVWSCSNCYHVLHLRCIKKWAKSSKAESGWRCPACQNVTSKMPQEYRCFCGKMRDPEWNRQDLPHSCGEVCRRARAPRAPELGLCVHRCTLLCHPGPCPPCLAQVCRECGCGKTSQTVSCGSLQPLLCEATCDKMLNCELHKCTKSCHWGECGSCEHIVKQECFCGKSSREVPCTADTSNVLHFSCQVLCDKFLTCGNHKCSLVCHDGACIQCELMPNLVTHCPCGKTPLTKECPRTSCLAPVPTCGQLCAKQLKCGQPGNYHECQAVCHVGPCPPCPLTTFVKCRCGHMDREIDCKDLTTKADDARCEKRCSKKRACGKHKCNQNCCIDVDHQCPLPCNHTLSCGQHRCEELCHRGHCQPCWRSSFEELYCECGASVILPPVACGTRRPACTQPCSRPHPCEHEALHVCHSEPSCPPCTVLMEKYCYGKHELRKAVPCHQTEFSCGMPCALPLPCGRHTCIKPCHKGSCVREGQPVCTQPCKTTRSLCGHPCAAPCHDGPCPETPCKETVRVTCECGHRSTTRPCFDQTKEYRRVLTALLASKMQDVQLGHAVDVADLYGNPTARAMSLKTLDCNDECKIIDRNRRLAIGLQIRNPDLSSKLQPRYSEFMRQWGKKDPFFVTMVHDRLTELVQLAKQSKQKSRSYSFSTMNREKRHFIHEYCEHFGCESQAYDPEPNRNVVATAQRDRAWLPSMSLLEVLQRESGQRKVPKPVTARAVDTRIKESPPLLSTLQTKSSEGGSKTDKEKVKEEKEEVEIDYFECTS